MTTSTVYERIRTRAAEVCEERHIRPVEQPDAARSLIEELVREHQTTASAGRADLLGRPEQMVDRIWRALAEYGPLTELFARQDVEEVFIEGDRVSYIEEGGRLQALNEPTSERENRHIVERLLEGTGRRLDATSAIQQAHVLDGRGRLTAVIEPVSQRLSATLRMYTAADETLGSLVRRSVWSPPAASFLWALAQVRASVLISGPTGAGKTTALGGFLKAVPPDQCVRVVEEVRELNLPLSLHSSFYEASGVGLDGERRYTLRHLIKVCLAMRVDMLCVGEVRGEEAFELIRAVNAGGGFCCTIHSDSAERALTSLVSAAKLAAGDMSPVVLRSIFAESLDAVVYLDRQVRKDGSEVRQCREIILVRPVVDGSSHWNTEPLFDRQGGELRWTGLMPRPELCERIERVLPDGVTLPQVLEGEWSPE
ncbi:MAG: ATPase, T2SS/T4P/T4SS family [Actinomycetota bacterium]